MTVQTSKSIFQLNQATFFYPYEEPVLKEISFDIHEGERICILGANGCGKSTLLKIFAGLLFPQKGTFCAFSQEMTAQKLNEDSFSKAYHKRVGFIFQDSDVQLFCSTVEEEIAFGLLQQNISHSEVQERISDIAKMLEMEHLLQKPPFKLSGGEKKKVALAAVLVMNPDVLILDEPTNGLDPRTQMWLIGLLQSLSKVGKTIITSTHNLNLVSQISDRAILFREEHTIAADSSTCELIQNVELLRSVNLVDEYYHI
ncbi:MAG TPA: ABC transporter ATP-binding protein [Oscillospiraceae bacterium]|nr:ABC transporter ATP-binding protein [Oscillospiraceae bacterium]